MVSQQITDQAGQGNAANADAFQQSRQDLQTTSSELEQSQSQGTSSTGPAKQEDLSASTLRVGESSVTVANTTKTTPSGVAGDNGTGLLWMVIVVVGIILILWAWRRFVTAVSKQIAAEEILGETPLTTSAASAKPKAKKKPKPSKNKPAKKSKKRP